MAQQVVSNAVVSRRMCDILQLFPSAAMGGVRWKTLVRKYQERYSAKLDITSLGYDSPLAAAATLLWEVVRVVDSSDATNPLLAIEDEVALMAQPGSLATWPSLYAAICHIVSQQGTLEIVDLATGQEPTQVLLLSQLKSLLQENWHPNFSESSLTYFNDDGSSKPMKKMKHLVRAVIRLRDQHVSQISQCAGRAAMREALAQGLQLVESRNHNDLLLQLVRTGDESAAQGCASTQSYVMSFEQDVKFEASTEVALNESNNTSASGIHSASADRQQEIAALPAENAFMRQRREFLKLCQQVPQTNYFCSGESPGVFQAPQQPDAVFEGDPLDNPFEPPPQKINWQWATQSSAPTVAGSSIADPDDVGFSTGCHSLHSTMTSGHVTPMCIPGAAGFQYHGAWGSSVPDSAFVQGWFERTTIPSGIVQETRALFERVHSGIPSFFVQS